ncbi:alpha/beta fold hydrolase [Neolewinella lacunae]|uniref:Alpha/beta fold hydrolase n=1 Tax=Neolewinella lacunae TaxID=1517758 RepID=A0A923PL63_9BACT|nr:alpha/beta fold hydrolase [Neolewinella lacunae]MBC6993228.1 alpha/beta fold hydrolase [Neolewinella lacunae]MDN3635725.1 alpha/beta fold hydrolase [Neolewinella lacunae]
MISRFRAHYQTIVPNLFRSVPVDYRRERITTPDGDFLDLDWLDHPASRQLVVLSHGLEGDSRRVYVASAARYFHRHGWHALAWNCRSCSGEMNLTEKLYSHGQVEDLETVINHALATGLYDRVVLLGYSMGGNLTLKYLGTQGKQRPEQVTHGVAFSAPVFIAHSADSLDRAENIIYRLKFRRALTEKIRRKEAQFPGRVDFSRLKDVRVWRDFDRWFSAPIGGFDDLDAYYDYLSSGNFVAGTTAPVLIVNATNDPIVPPACSPHELAATHPLIHLEQPHWGGHVGFALRGKPHNWMDERALAFVNG